MLKKRLVTALWGIPLIIVVVWFNTPITWFTLLAAVCGGLGVFEFYRLAGVLKTIPLAILGGIITILFIIYPHIRYSFNLPPASLVLTGAVILSLIMLVFLPKEEGLFIHWATMAAGVLYIGWMLSFLILLRLEPGTAAFPEAGRNFVFLALFATFGSDTAAYFIGKAIGRHKLSPQISPGKTWEGTAAGIIGGVIICLLFTIDTPLQLPLNYWQAVLLGVLVSVFGQIGDLVESLVKRNYGVKDSGSLMPGHGGMLDRMDSILFAGVVVYIYYSLAVV
ncbi:MAG: phosphatidate cytidylyltransferase [Dehalococcoidales bacterium]|nr:phosphatidate cytidylyltransferase [Dehalococcoidales bacterium]